MHGDFKYVLKALLKKDWSCMDIVNKIITDILPKLCEHLLSAGVFAVCLTLIFNQIIDRRKKNKEICMYLNSLHGEISAILSIIKLRKAEFINSRCMDLENYRFEYIPISYNYCTVYENNSDKIGMIKNKELVHSIIYCYTNLKGLFENVKDLEQISKQSYTHILEHPSGSTIFCLVKWHYDYCNHIIYKQEPLVEEELEKLLVELEKEIKEYDRKLI